MNIVYTKESLTENTKPTIFLAGPVPRDHHPEHWRKDAIDYLDQKQFTGTVYCPMLQGCQYIPDHEYNGTHMDWEYDAMHKSDLILFWMPRDMKRYLALTSNIEWGMWFDTGKVVLGYPTDAEHMDHIHHFAERHEIAIAHTLHDTIDNGLTLLRLRKKY